MKAVLIPLRLLQFFWSLLILALVGNMIHDATAGNPSVVNYQIFVGAFSMLSLLYLIPATFREEFSVHPAGPPLLDLLNTLFFFCGAVALAAKLGAHSCGNKGYIKSNSVTNGAKNMSKRCHEAQATDAFLFFGFACYAASLVFSALGARGSGTTGLRGRGGIARSNV
ncbi:MAG: hypothetical protein M1824_004334 [Vezdaea acicularis]|nr:MAG: hypothetical protein M1824_004334 [Vezdaea acicularis]